MKFERIADKKRVNFIAAALRQNVAPGDLILDVGCGNGIITRYIGELGYHVIGVDNSEKAIAKAAASNYLRNVEFKVLSADKLTSEPAKYAAVICSEVLEHLADPASLLRNMRTSLRDDGIVVVTVPNGTGPRELFVTRPVQSMQKSNGPAWKIISSIKRILGYKETTMQSDADDLRHLQFFTYKSLTRLANATGFEIESTSKTNFVEQVFPFSFFARKSRILQQLDCRLADFLPLALTSGFMTVWKKKMIHIRKWHHF
jgi:2-polyprenyl-3-methyl-5-hydroxy-6-metoxy-1,4-benzoquinol methylase